MRQSMGSTSLALPPLVKSAKIILGILVAIWLLMIGSYYFAPQLAMDIAHYAYLNPAKVMQGWLFQLATYMFFHSLDSPFHLLMNGLLVYFFAGAVEGQWGVQKTLWFSFGAGIAGGLMVVIFHLLGLLFGFGAGAQVLGFSGAALGLLAVFCLQNREAQVLLFFVLPIRAKYILPLSLGVDFLMWLVPSSNHAFSAHLGGALFGMFFVKGWWTPRGLRRKMRYWKIKRELDRRRKSKDDKVVKGPWLN